MTEPKKRFEVGKVAIDEDGMWWFYYVGTHADQGGLTYRWGSIGLTGPLALGQAIGAAMKIEEDEYLKKLQQKASKDEKPGKI